MFYSEDRPGVSNLMDIHSALTGLTYKEIEAESQSLNTGQYKQHVADVVISHLRPIRDEINRLRQDIGHVKRVLLEGQVKASCIANEHMNEIKHLVGLK